MKFLDLDGVQAFKAYNDSVYITAEDVDTVDPVPRDTYTKDEIDENNEVISAALNDLNSRIEDTESSIENVVNTIGETEIPSVYNLDGVDYYSENKKLYLTSCPQWVNIVDKPTVRTSIRTASSASNTDIVSEKAISSALSAKEATSNKVTSLSNSSTNTQYPSAKCVYDALQTKLGQDEEQVIASALNALNANKENVSNKVTSISSTSTDNQYPSALAVYEALQDAAGGGDENVIEDITFNGSSVPISNKTAQITGQAALVSGVNIKTINNESILGSGNITITGGGMGEVELDTSDITNGIYISKSDGSEVSYSGWSATDFIDISEGTQIKADRTLDYSAFYSSASTSGFISSANINTSYLAIPSNAKYVRISGSTSDMNAATVTILASTSNTGEENVIEVVKVNGTALTPDANKAVDITVPTESTVSGWGFTKNTGTYSKPSGGIPATDLDSAVQASLDKADSAYQYPSGGIPKANLSSGVKVSLGKADTAIQSVKVNGTALTPDANNAVDVTVPTDSTVSGWGYIKTFTETDPTVPSWAKASTKPTYTASEVGALPDTTVIPAAPGTLKTNNTTAQTASASEALSGTINLHKVAKTGTYSDLIGTPTIPTESTVSGWGFTKNSGTVTGVKMNGTTNNPTSGVVDLGTVITSETSLSKGTTTGNGNAVTDISVSGHTITLTKGSTFLTSETQLSKGTTSGSGNVVTDLSVSGHTVTLTKGSNVPVATSANAGKIPMITSSGGWEYVTPSAIYSGSATPNNNTGNNGDVYLQM